MSVNCIENFDPTPLLESLMSLEIYLFILRRRHLTFVNIFAIKQYISTVDPVIWHALFVRETDKQCMYRLTLSENEIIKICCNNLQRAVSCMSNMSLCSLPADKLTTSLFFLARRGYIPFEKRAKLRWQKVLSLSDCLNEDEGCLCLASSIRYGGNILMQILPFFNV